MEHLPTQAEIRAACERIQAGWSPRQEAARRLGVSAAKVRTLLRDAVTAPRYACTFEDDQLVGFVPLSGG